MTSNNPVLVVGGTGALGGQVVTNLLSRGKRVRALVRPTSNASRLEQAGVEIARGDMMDPASLARAVDGVDAVVTSAAGYTRHSKSDTVDIDTIGNRNLVDAAAEVGVRRFVLTSVLECDKTPQVPHFWHKKLVEDRLEQRGVPFVSLRPGAFTDSLAQLGGDPFAKGRLTWAGSATTPLTFVRSADVARHLAEAVDASVVDGERIDIGWDRPVSLREFAEITTALLGREVTVRTVPGGVVAAFGAIFGPFSPAVKDRVAMIKWFQSGGYVADPTRQREVFGEVPTAEEAIGAFLAGLGHAVTA